MQITSSVSTLPYVRLVNTEMEMSATTVNILATYALA